MASNDFHLLYGLNRKLKVKFHVYKNVFKVVIVSLAIYPLYYILSISKNKENIFLKTTTIYSDFKVVISIGHFKTVM